MYTHRFCEILLDHEREPCNPFVKVDLHDLKSKKNWGVAEFSTKKKFGENENEDGGEGRNGKERR